MNETIVDKNLDVFKVARSQKNMLLLYLGGILLIVVLPALMVGLIFVSFPSGALVILMMLVRLGLLVVALYFIYRMAFSLKLQYPILWMLVMLVPLVNLIMLLVLNAKATKTIRKSGFRVGLLGANLKKMKEKLGQATVPVTPEVPVAPTA